MEVPDSEDPRRTCRRFSGFIRAHQAQNPERMVPTQVSFGVHKTEQDAARQYDRALIIVKGRLAKTNFPMADYELEVEMYEAYILERCVRQACLWWCERYREVSRNMGEARRRPTVSR